MVAQVDITADQGANLRSFIVVANTVTGNVINIAGYTFTSQMRKGYLSANSSANLVCTKTDSANGILLLSLGAANTLNIDYGKYYYDVLGVDANNITSRIAQGILTITPGVTR